MLAQSIFLAALVAAACLCAGAVPEGAEVAEFPGFAGELPSKHYAG
jgi:serine carboxypeptidase-like clade I